MINTDRRMTDPLAGLSSGDDEGSGLRASGRIEPQVESGAELSRSVSPATRFSTVTPLRERHG